MTTITMTRTIHAPALKVFEAWTDPQQIQQWLAPHPSEVRVATADARRGGRYTILVADPEGKLHTTSGEYRELVPGARLVQTWEYKGPNAAATVPSRLTVELREVSAGVTELALTHAELPDEKIAADANHGWELCLDQLAALVGAQRSA
jgi:uncharacterized protein YndB with AHSA1/START domain